MMFMGLLTIVVLPLFLLVSARMIATGEHAGELGTRIGVGILYVFTAITVASGFLMTLYVL
jgi:hypothetical protein